MEPSIEERFETQQKSFNECLAAMETQLTAKMEQLHTQAAGGNTSATEAVQEMEDRQSRTNNLILFSVPESRAETSIARNAEDANIGMCGCQKSQNDFKTSGSDNRGCRKADPGRTGGPW